MQANPPTQIPSLLLDLYELTMAQSYLDQGMNGVATFSLFARHLPKDWGYFLAAGLDDVLTYLKSLAFGPSDLDYLESTGLFVPRFLAHLWDFHFAGAVQALPEGTVYFPDEPVLEVTAPLIQAQIVETAILNQVHFQTLIASKAARCVEVAAGRRLVEFGARRSHGFDAVLKAARGTYLAGFAATSNVLAGQRYGIPIAGTWRTVTDSTMSQSPRFTTERVARSRRFRWPSAGLIRPHPRSRASPPAFKCSAMTLPPRGSRPRVARNMP